MLRIKGILQNNGPDNGAPLPSLAQTFVFKKEDVLMPTSNSELLSWINSLVFVNTEASSEEFLGTII